MHAIAMINHMRRMLLYQCVTDRKGNRKVLKGKPHIDRNTISHAFVIIHTIRIKSLPYFNNYLFDIGLSFNINLT